VVNPPLGIGKIGGRLFGEPIQTIESDLTATALVLGAADRRVVILAVDLCTVDALLADQLRTDVASALGVPLAHVLLNESYALPDQLPQFYPHQITALHPDSEQRALDATVALIDRLV
jgi:hypothetical protein